MNLLCGTCRTCVYIHMLPRRASLSRFMNLLCGTCRTCVYIQMLPRRASLYKNKVHALLN